MTPSPLCHTLGLMRLCHTLPYPLPPLFVTLFMVSPKDRLIVMFVPQRTYSKPAFSPALAEKIAMHNK